MIFGTDEKIYRKFLLQFLDGVGNCGLCDVEFLGSLGNTVVLADHAEVF